MNARIFFEYAYLAIALYCAYEAYQLWNAAQGKPYIDRRDTSELVS